MIERRTLLLGAAALLLGTLAGVPGAAAAEPIKIGDINSYTGLPAFTIPYRNGWQMALEEINKSGGVLGRKIEVVSYDDGGKPGEAINRAEQLVSKDHVVALMGTFFSNIGLAVASFAQQNKIYFMAAEPLTDAITWEKGNRYTFRLRPNTYMQADMLAEAAAKLPAKRWATVAPNYEYGQSAVEDFKKLLSARRPDIQWVSAQWPALGKIDAGATVEALAQAKPDAIYNVLFGGDLTKFVREGNTRGLFQNRAVVSLLTGEPEYIDPLKDETPKGWIVTGYPWYAIKTPAHEKFLKAYMAKYKDHPRMGSLVGYNTMLAVADALRKAGSTSTEKLIKATEGMRMATPMGEITFRAIDHQSTMGTWVGKTDVKNGEGVMVDWHYADGAKYLPSNAEIKKMRPAD
ncbi:MAG TPA: ABC transporter substrate-binding protein [Alphaproteobacteria bacterium]|nr:ABC transporter substrate-binding protein [Alphaproteobacteria bacterium]